MAHRMFEFSQKHDRIGHLEQLAGNHVGICLPIHFGITFIGRQVSACEFRDRESLAGVIEAAQVLLKVDATGWHATDATSTNQTSLVRQRHAEAFLAGAMSRPSDDIIELPHESFETQYSARRWVRVFGGDLLVHPYGSWSVVTETPGE